MNDIIEKQLNEYREQLAASQKQTLALTGAMQALINLQKAIENGSADSESGDSTCAGEE